LAADFVAVRVGQQNKGHWKNFNGMVQNHVAEVSPIQHRSNGNNSPEGDNPLEHNQPPSTPPTQRPRETKKEKLQDSSESVNEAPVNKQVQGCGSGPMRQTEEWNHVVEHGAATEANSFLLMLGVWPSPDAPNINKTLLILSGASRLHFAFRF
jgi:hypothetical protein